MVSVLRADRVTGIVQKRLGFMLLYCALLYTDMFVSIFTGLGVVRHIYQAAGAEGMSKAHRDIKFLIEIYWILELRKYCLSCASAVTLT